MGVYADTLADINAQIDRTEFEIDAIEGTKSMTIYVYQIWANRVDLLIQNMLEMDKLYCIHIQAQVV